MTSSEEGNGGEAADADPETYDEWISAKKGYHREAVEEAEKAGVHVHVRVADGGEFNWFDCDEVTFNDECPAPSSSHQKSWAEKMIDVIRSWVSVAEPAFLPLLLIPFLFPYLGSWAIVLMSVITTILIVF